MSARVRAGVCADFREEGWPSMDRVADSLVACLARDHAQTVDASLVYPPFVRRVSRVLATPSTWNIDRGWNRLLDYPRHAAKIAGQYDVFHVVDHSYSQLVHRLPASRTVVTCHDLDTFRSILDPQSEPRPALFRAMTRHILAGLQRAARVTCDTAAVRDELIARSLVPASRIVVAPIGVADEFSPDADPDADRDVACMILGSRAPADTGDIEILHVGSTVRRKRIDTLLASVAEVRRMMPRVRLVRVGGAFTSEQQELVRHLDLAAHVTVLPPLNDRALAAAYRRAALVVLPSEREGFGLPVVEAMASGTPVVASDLAVLREVGGGIAGHCAPGDAIAWARTVTDLLRERSDAPERWADRRRLGTLWARRFTWAAFADRMAEMYSDLAACPV